MLQRSIDPAGKRLNRYRLGAFDPRIGRMAAAPNDWKCLVDQPDI